MIICAVNAVGRGGRRNPAVVSNEICPNEGNDAGSASHRQPLIVRLAIDWLSYLGQGQVSDRSSSHPVTILCSTIKASQVALVVKKKKTKNKPNQTKTKQKQKKPHILMQGTLQMWV